MYSRAEACTTVSEATIELRDGSTVTVKGTPEEVARILAMVQHQGEAKDGPANLPRAKQEVGKGASSKTGPKADILRLKADGFFKGQRRAIKEVQEGLEAQGHIYPVTTLSGALLALVQKRELGRVKQDGVWRYVHRD
jgi:hypothetical protein